MASIGKTDKFQLIENDPSFMDVFSEIAGITQYHANGVDYVNISFMAHKVSSMTDEQGRPVISKIGLKKVSSVTMTLDRAIALRDALVGGMVVKPSDEE